jgi:hypothetical protein
MVPANVSLEMASKPVDLRGQGIREPAAQRAIETRARKDSPPGKHPARNNVRMPGHPIRAEPSAPTLELIEPTRQLLLEQTVRIGQTDPAGEVVVVVEMKHPEGRELSPRESSPLDRIPGNLREIQKPKATARRLEKIFAIDLAHHFVGCRPG